VNVMTSGGVESDVCTGCGHLIIVSFAGMGK
jgi:hypothetical protein